MFLSPTGVPYVAYTDGSTVEVMKPLDALTDPWTPYVVANDPAMAYHSVDMTGDGRSLMVVAIDYPLHRLWCWLSYDDGISWSGPTQIV